MFNQCYNYSHSVLYRTLIRISCSDSGHSSFKALELIQDSSPSIADALFHPAFIQSVDRGHHLTSTCPASSSSQFNTYLTSHSVYTQAYYDILLQPLYSFHVMLSYSNWLYNGDTKLLLHTAESKNWATGCCRTIAHAPLSVRN